MEEWTGMAEGTIKDWFNNKGRPTAEFALQLLERIPEKARHENLESACRLCTTFEHPRLKCDQTILSLLRTIICQPRGLTVIQGGNDESRTFLVAAMGHSYLGLTERPHRVAGLDVHATDWFVPVPGVHYLNNLFQADRLREAAFANWPEVPVRGTQLVLLNGISCALVDFQSRLRALTAKCPVIIAEVASIKPSLLKRTAHGPIHVITVSKHPDNGKGIAVAIEAI
jgi:hypothetical protein